MPVFYMPPGPLVMTGTTCCYNRRPLTHALTSSTVSATERNRKVATERSPVVGFELPQSLAHPAETFQDSHRVDRRVDKTRETVATSQPFRSLPLAFPPTKRELRCAVKPHSPRTGRVQSKFSSSSSFFFYLSTFPFSNHGYNHYYMYNYYNWYYYCSSPSHRHDRRPSHLQRLVRGAAAAASQTACRVQCTEGNCKREFQQFPKAC